MKFEPYSFQNVYLITTYRCNWACKFCLFRFNREREASIDEIMDRLAYSIEDSARRVYIKITGGEPFLKLDLLERVFEVCGEYSDKVYKVGIGTNGSIALPQFFNRVGIRTHIFLSRHDIEDDLPRPTELGRNVTNPLIDFRINCNLIKGGVDSLEKIKRYIDNKNASYGVTHYCFRELSKVDIDVNSIYPEQIYDYIDYYAEHLVRVSDVEEEMATSGAFRLSRRTGNYYDINHWYWYEHSSGRLSVKFRTIDETRLIEFNEHTRPDAVDEYVIHPDGTLTGCWDKELKVIMKGGEYNAKSPIHTETLEE